MPRAMPVNLGDACIRPGNEAQNQRASTGKCISFENKYTDVMKQERQAARVRMQAYCADHPYCPFVREPPLPCALVFPARLWILAC